MSRPLAIAGIQARLSSTRLPGKMLMDLGGKPLIQRVVERVSACRLLDRVLVLTSAESSDDALAEACQGLGIAVRRGSLADVTSRYEALADEFDPLYLVRITGDCPLVEPAFIDLQIGALREFDGDFTCFDHGAEIGGVLGGQTVMSQRAFREGAQSKDALDREHVANFYFQSHVENFRYVAARVGDAYRVPGLRLSVDEPGDLALLRAIYHHFSIAGDSLFELRKVLQWLAENPEVCALNQSVVESAANRDLQAMPPSSERHIVGRFSKPLADL